MTERRESMDQKQGDISRRGFLGAAAGATAVILGARGGGEERKKIPIALELYSVRDHCAKDLPKTLAQVAKMGYQGVEFAGYHGKDAKELRRILDENGLKCCGTHTGLDTLLGDKLAQTVEFNRTIGNKFLIVPGLPKERKGSAKAWSETAKLFNEIAGKVKADGMRVGYHNHSEEFGPIEGKTPWDIFFDAADPEVVMQVDTGNAMHGGADPVELIRKHPGRTATTHVKEFSKAKPKALIGEGEMKWKEYLGLCETVGKTEWYIVEYETDPAQPMESMAGCLKGLRKLLGVES
jgi:sugar phosphate isomerase/epimerase